MGKIYDRRQSALVLNSVSKDWFFADESAKNGWFKYRISEDSEDYWWWHEASGRFFMDQRPGAIATGQ